MTKFHIWLYKLPWIRQGLSTRVAPNRLFYSLKEKIHHDGFTIIAEDLDNYRLVFHHTQKYYGCHCIHVIWIRNIGKEFYISFGIEPRYKIFLFCRKINHLDKLKRLRDLIRRSEDTESSI